jgi:hypothetical protein
MFINGFVFGLRPWRVKRLKWIENPAAFNPNVFFTFGTNGNILGGRDVGN